MPWVNARGSIAASGGFTPPEELPPDRLERVRTAGWHWVQTVTGGSEADRRARYVALWREAENDRVLAAERARMPADAWVDASGRTWPDGEVARPADARRIQVRPGWSQDRRAAAWYEDALRERISAEMSIVGRPAAQGFVWVNAQGDLHPALVRADAAVAVRRLAENAGWRRVHVSIGTSRNGVRVLYQQAARTTETDEARAARQAQEAAAQAPPAAQPGPREADAEAWMAVADALLDALGAVPRSADRETRTVVGMIARLLARTEPAPDASPQFPWAI